MEAEAGVNPNKPVKVRRSDWLKSDIALTTKEKNEAMARKRNLEGTSCTSTIFSKLPNKTMLRLSANMGVDVNHISFGTFDLLRDLEVARNKLHTRKNESTSVDSIEVTEDKNDINERLIEWLQDDLSETESDILAHSKKKRENA